MVNKICSSCYQTKKHQAKGMCRSCYEKSDEYKQWRSIRRTGRIQTSQVGRVKPVRPVNQVLRKVTRTGGLTDSKEVITNDIILLRNELIKIYEQ